MRWGLFVQVTIKKLKTDWDEIERRRELPRVKALEASFEEFGGEPGNAVWIDGANNLIAGRDRIAAQLNRGAKKCWAHIVADATQEQIEDLEDEEGIQRRHGDRDALIARKVARARARLEEKAAAEGRSLSPKAATVAARGEVADRHQMSREAVKKAERRATAIGTNVPIGASRQQDKSDAPGTGDAGAGAPPPPAAAPSSSPPPPVEAWGESIRPSLRDEIRPGVADLEEVSRALGKLMGRLTSGQVTAFGAHVYQQLYPDLHRLAERARSLVPVAVCPACGGESTTCLPCRGLGVITESQRKAATAPKDRRPPERPGRRVTIEMPGGGRFEPDGAA